MSLSLDNLPLQQRKPLRISTDIPLFTRCSSDCSSDSPSPSNQSITPGTTPSTGIPQYFYRALCLHDFESSDPVHLPFHRDEVLTIIKQEHSGWWAAMRPQGDRIGWIPSSFVLPLDRGMIVEYSDETPAPRPYERLNDPPLSAIHDPWVPVSEDCAVCQTFPPDAKSLKRLKALSFRLVTPTDFTGIRYNGFFDDRVRNHDHESFSPQDDEQSYCIEDICVPPTPENSPPRSAKRPLPQYALPPRPSAHLAGHAGPPLDVALHHQPRLSRIDNHTSRLCLTTPVGSDETSSELISTLDLGNSLVLRSVTISQDGTHSRDGVHDQSQCLASPTDFRCASPDFSVSPMIWGPDQLAQQLCVLAHALYAAIRQNDCFDWMTGRKSAEVTRLQHFFDVHDYIASWVQRSILAYDDITRQTETLEFWIRVAEKCRTFRNFDSLHAIISALRSSLPSSPSVLARCAHEQTLANMLDAANSMKDGTMGPSVPFVRGYLDHIKQLRFPDKPLHAGSGYNSDAGLSATFCTMPPDAVSTLLRHQSSPYGFKITKSIRSFIDDKLQTIV